MIRAVKTAEIINEKFNVPIKLDDRLIEIDFGDYVGKNCLKDKEFIEAKHYTGDKAFPNGESYKDFTHRIHKAINEICKEYKDYKCILIVAHGNILRVAHWYFNELPQKGKEEIIRPGNCEIYEYEVRSEN